MKKIVIVKMQDFKDCGICSMLSIIKYYGGYVSLETLREDTLCDNSGTSALHMVKTFQKYNFDAMGYYINDITNNNLTKPFIAHLKLDNDLYHYVVIYDIIDDYIILMDPSVGKKKLNINEFNKYFTGNVINVIPNSKIEIINKKNSFIDLINSFILLEKHLLIKIVLTSIIITILTIVLSYFFKIASTFINNNYKMYILIIIFFLFTILKVTLEYVKNIFINTLNIEIDSKIYNEFIHHIFNLPLRAIKSRTTGEIITRIGELKEIKNIFSEVFVTIFLELLLALGAMIVLLILNHNLFIILCLFIIVYFIFGLITSKSIYKKVMINLDHETDFNTTIVENIEMYESIKNLNANLIVVSKINKVCNDYFLNTFDFVKFYNKIILVKNLLLEICFFIINAYGFILIMNNKLTLINLITFNLLINYAISPLKNIIDLLPSFNYLKAIFVKMQDFINIDEENNKHKNIEKIKGNININNLSYSYNYIDNILNNITLSIRTGDHVFLKGKSGCGKSTLCNIMYRNILNYKGDILFDDKNLLDYELSTIRNNIIYISQQEKLFTASIKENILFERNRSDKEFQKVAKICEIESIIKNKKLRYDSIVNDNSKSLSGGEKQRIILARGLLKMSSILIIDESLSEVDYKMEQRIIKNIRNNYKDKTIIYISHKDHKKLFDYEINLSDK